MRNVKQKVKKYVRNYKLKPIVEQKNRILEYLYELEKKEAKLWGVIVLDIEDNENRIIEETNHLIYLINKNDYKSLNDILNKKDVDSFLSDLEEIRKDFSKLKKSIRDQNKLKLLISNFTIKILDFENYNKFKNIFLLEKKLNDVLDMQEIELNRIFEEAYKIKINTEEEKIEYFVETLKDIRNILSGHLDNLKHFDEEREGYSNTSNIINELINIFKQEIE